MQSNEFRLTGVQSLYNNGVKDIITALDGLASRYKIDKSDIKVMGCSRGAQVSALFATNLSRYSQEYKVTKTIVSSSTYLDMTLGALKYHQKKVPPSFSYNSSRDDIGLFYNVDWLGGAVCPMRPKGVYTDEEWKNIVEMDKTKAEKYLKKYPTILKRFPSLKKTICTDAYKKNSATYHLSNLQGDILTTAGDDEYAAYSSLYFKKKDKSGRVSTIIHPESHCHGLSTSKDTIVSIYSQFLNSCEQDYTDKDISKIREKMSKIFDCLISEKQPSQYLQTYLPYSNDSDIFEINRYGAIILGELEKMLHTYEKDFSNCKNKKNPKRCRWQMYQTYNFFHNRYSYLLDNYMHDNGLKKDCKTLKHQWINQTPRGDTKKTIFIGEEVEKSNAQTLEQ